MTFTGLEQKLTKSELSAKNAVVFQETGSSLKPRTPAAPDADEICNRTLYKGSIGCRRRHTPLPPPRNRPADRTQFSGGSHRVKTFSIWAPRHRGPAGSRRLVACYTYDSDTVTKHSRGESAAITV